MSLKLNCDHCGKETDLDDLLACSKCVNQLCEDIEYLRKKVHALEDECDDLASHVDGAFTVESDKK